VLCCGKVCCCWVWAGLFVSGDAASPVAGPPPQSPFLTSPVGVESLLGSPVMSPRRPPRKIPRAPYKVRSV